MEPFLHTAVEAGIAIFSGLAAWSNLSLRAGLDRMRAELTEARAKDREELKTWINGSFMRSATVEANLGGLRRRGADGPDRELAPVIAIALGKLTVAAAGTPTPITAAMILAAGDGRPPAGGVNKIEVWADPASTGTVYAVKGTTKIAALPKPSGAGVHWAAKAPEGGNTLNPLDFGIDAVTNGDGAFVTLWID